MTMLPGQLDMFGSTVASTSPAGLTIILPRPCRSCGETMAVIGSSKGPHCAELHCVACDMHVGWMGRESFNFVAAIIDRFGRPEDAIVVREPVNRLSSWSS
jgi:hypothetical protein